MLIYNALAIKPFHQGHPHCEAMMTLRDDLETEIMFSELRCKKILPTAMAVYKEGLPQHYTQEYHQVGGSWCLIFHTSLSWRAGVK